MQEQGEPTGCAPQKGIGADVQALNTIRARLEFAENNGDSDAIGAMLAEDVVLMVPNEPVRKGNPAAAGFIREMLADLLDKFQRRIAYVSDEVLIAGNVAFDRGHFSFTATRKDDGSATHATGKYFWLYSRAGAGPWQLSRVVISLDDPPEAEEGHEERGVQLRAPNPAPLLRHFLAAVAYRTQKALRGASDSFGGFAAGGQTRTPAELIRHMTSVLGYARTFFVGGHYRPEPLPDLAAEVARFHAVVEDLGQHLDAGTELRGTTAERLLQGPFADAMTHAGQLAILRRLAGSPVAPENFIVANIDAANLGPVQPDPVSPDAIWPEAPGADA